MSVEGSALSVDRSPAAAAGVDSQNPWPGLAPFTEAESSLFHGRDEEVRTLLRLIERKPLTVLFGQSGLGKSSLLQAGVFPLLRATGYCPSYIRLDHSEGAPPPAEQVKAFVRDASTRAGTWTKPGVAQPGESLWEYFHHRDDRLVDKNRDPVIPVLVIDQFEELFTLGAGVGAQRDRAVGFMTALAELVENRVPDPVVTRLEQSPDDLEAFDFARTDYRVCLSLREDFLPQLETLAEIMPALMENRMRLTRMTGTQALAAVIKPGAGLVNEAVARTIVEFVSGARGGSAERLAELTVEPPLLSVICHELNERRRALGHPQITADLVTGNRREILNDFYERSVADLPAAMRAFVEDKLLTKSGFRDNLALETALEEPGVTQSLIDTLVTRRLLRIEDRIGTQRVELTHDVLAEVIRAARDERQQRQALEAAQERERSALAAAHRHARRQRFAIAGLGLIVIGLSIGAVFGLRAQRLAAEQVGRADLFTGSRMLDEGKVGDGLAYLVSAASREYGTSVAAPRILTTLASRSFLLPAGAPLQLPSPSESAFFLADGRSVLVQSVDGRVQLIDATGGKIVREYQFDHKVQSKGLQIAAKNPAVFAVALVNGTVVVCDTSSARPRLAPMVLPVADQPPLNPGETAPSAAPPVSFVLSPDGRWVAAFLSSGRTRYGKMIPGITVILDAATGAERTRIEGQNLNYDSGPYYRPFSSDGSRFVTSLSEYSDTAVGSGTLIKSTTEIRSMPDGKVIATLAHEPRVHVYTSAFSAQGKHLLISGYSYELDGFFSRVFDVETGAAIGPAIKLENRGGTLDAWLTPDGTRVIYAHSDRNVYVYEVATAQPVFPGWKHGGPVFGAGLSDDGALFATNSVDGLYRLWDLQAGALHAECSFKLERRGEVAFAPDGRSHVVISAAGLVRRLQLTSGPAAPLVLPRTLTSPTLLHFAATPPARLEWFTTTQARLFDVASGRFIEGGFAFPHEIMGWFRPTFGLPLLAGQSLIVRRDPAGPRAWTMGENGVTKEVDFSDPLPALSTFPGRGFTVSTSTRLGAAPFAPPGEQKALGIWDLRTGQRLGKIPMPAPLRNKEFSPDERWIAVLDETTTRAIRVYEIATAKLRVTINPEPHAPFGAMWFSPDGARLITGDAWGTVQFWDSATGKLMQSVQAHSFGVTRFIFSDDQRYFASLSDDGSVQVWDSATYATVGAPRMQSATTQQAYFNADATRISTSASNGTARIWDVRSGVPLNDSMDHKGLSLSVASFSPDGRFVTTRTGGGGGGADAQRLWAAPPAGRIGRAPKWLLEFATICAGRRLNDEGKIVSAMDAFERLDELRREIAALPADDAYGEWARWFLSDSPTRSIAPGFTATPADAKKIFDELTAAKIAAEAVHSPPSRTQPVSPKGKKAAPKK